MIWCYSKTFARHFAFSTYSFLVIGNKESQRQLATMSFGRDNVSASVFITKRKKNNKRRLKTSKTACEWNLCWNTFACRNVFMSSPSPSSILFLGCFHPTENMSLSMMSRRINEKHKEKSETEKKNFGKILLGSYWDTFFLINSPRTPSSSFTIPSFTHVSVSLCSP